MTTAASPSDRPLWEVQFSDEPSTILVAARDQFEALCLVLGVTLAEEPDFTEAQGLRCYHMPDAAVFIKKAGHQIYNDDLVLIVVAADVGLVDEGRAVTARNVYRAPLHVLEQVTSLLAPFRVY